MSDGGTKLPTPAGDGPQAADLLQGLLRRTHLSTAADLPGIVAEQAAEVGAVDVTLYMVDYAQELLVPLPVGCGKTSDPLSITGTVAGRAFATTSILRVAGDSEADERLWVPLLDGTERVGVMGMCFPTGALDDEMILSCERYAHLVAMLVVSKGQYSDLFERRRRLRPMTMAAELVWSLAPPMVAASEGLVVAGMLEPSYDNGGDALDYAINDGVLHFAVLDAMGHGLAAAGVAAFAVAAYRNSRRRDLDLPQTYAAMHEAVGEQFPDERFVTAVVGRLRLDTGQLEFICAGHPGPMLIRDGRHARTLDVTPVPPLGISVSAAEPVVSTESLEPGDLIVAYTDGLTEARLPDRSLVTQEGLSEFIVREASSGLSTPEVLRRLRAALVADEGTELRDDATALLIQWRGEDIGTVVPQTVI